MHIRASFQRFNAVHLLVIQHILPLLFAVVFWRCCCQLVLGEPIIFYTSKYSSERLIPLIIVMPARLLRLCDMRGHRSGTAESMRHVTQRNLSEQHEVKKKNCQLV